MNLPKVGRVYRNQQTGKLYKILEIGYDPNVAPNKDKPSVGRVVIYTTYGGDGKRLLVRSVEDFFARVTKGGDGEQASREVQRFIQVVPRSYRCVDTQFGTLKVPEDWRIARKNRIIGVMTSPEESDGSVEAEE